MLAVRGSIQKMSRPKISCAEELEQVSYSGLSAQALKSERTRAELLRAAEMIFARDGFEASRIEDSRNSSTWNLHTRRRSRCALLLDVHFEMQTHGELGPRAAIFVEAESSAQPYFGCVNPPKGVALSSPALNNRSGSRVSPCPSPACPQNHTQRHSPPLGTMSATIPAAITPLSNPSSNRALNCAFAPRTRSPVRK